MGWSADDVSSAVAFSRVSRGVDDVHTSTGVACAIFPTSSSACIILLMRAATGFFFGGILLGHSGGRYERVRLLPNYFLAGEQATANSPRAGDHSPLRAIYFQEGKKRLSPLLVARWSRPRASPPQGYALEMSASESILSEYAFARAEGDGETVRASLPRCVFLVYPPSPSPDPAPAAGGGARRTRRRFPRRDVHG